MAHKAIDTSKVVNYTDIEIIEVEKLIKNASNHKEPCTSFCPYPCTILPCLFVVAVESVTSNSMLYNKFISTLAALLIGFVALSAQTTKPQTPQPQQGKTAQQIWAERQTAIAKKQALKRQYIPLIKRSLVRMSSAVSAVISPRSGREFHGEILNNGDMEMNKKEGYVKCQVRLMWQARDFWRGVGYDWCEVKATAYYYPALRDIEKPKVVLKCHEINKHVRAVASEGKIQQLSEPILVEIDEVKSE